MQQLSKELLVGAIDLHTHGYPEITAEFHMALDDFEMLDAARAAGMDGYVLKSHLWPTMDRLSHLRPHLDGVHVVASIVMNPIVGGINPGVLEAAIAQGAGAVFFPTWGSRNDLARGGFSRLIRRELPSLASYLEGGLSAVDDAGVLTGAARDVLRVAKEHEVLVSTGHLSGPEAVALAREADRIDLRRLVFSHPDSNSVAATEEEILEAAKLGAFIEWTYVGMLPSSQRIKPSQVAEWVDRLGADRFVMTTDTFGRETLPEPLLFQQYIGVLLSAGVSPEAIRQMAVLNPHQALGLPLFPRS